MVREECELDDEVPVWLLETDALELDTEGLEVDAVLETVLETVGLTLECALDDCVLMIELDWTVVWALEELPEVMVDLILEVLLDATVLVLLDGILLEVTIVLMLEELLEGTVECPLDVTEAEEEVTGWLLEEALEDDPVEKIEVVALLLDEVLHWLLDTETGLLLEVLTWLLVCHVVMLVEDETGLLLDDEAGWLLELLARLVVGLLLEEMLV